MARKRSVVNLNAYRGIVGNPIDKAVVISLPKHFDIQRTLRDAVEIRLATAFARITGWKYLKSSIFASSAEIKLLTGLDFMQTEPNLLREWLQLAQLSTNVQAKLSSSNSIFHPKVLVVKGNDSNLTFAIVGSGNLTDGGLCTNTECGLYTANPSTVSALTKWFDEQWNRGTHLTKSAIKEYEPKYKASWKAAQRVRKDQTRVQKRIAQKAQQDEAKNAAILRDIEKAVAAFNEYRTGSQFKADYKARLNAAKLIRSFLHVPEFTFTRVEYDKFYNIGRLGSLRESWRNGIFKRQQRLRSALRYLVDETVPIDKRIDAILSPQGQYHIRGLGSGFVTKVLAATRPDKWPVLNGAVNDALKFFGYEPPHRLGFGGRYREFAKIMDAFRTKATAPDFIALDAFFKFWEQQIKKKHRK